MYSLVVPVYKNEAFITQLLEVCSWLDCKLNKKLEVIFVVDGSPDRSVQLLKEKLPTVLFDYQLVELSKNFGSFAAIRKGLELARGDYFAVMAADLQEPKELILKFFETLELEQIEVVIGSRESREDPRFSRWASSIFWGFYRRLIEPKMPKGGVDVFGCNLLFRDQLIRLEESHSSLVGLIFWMGFRRKIITYSRKERKYGKSAWTLSKKIRYVFDNIFSFTDLPIQLLIFFGATGLLTSFGLGGLIILSKVTGAIAVPGYAATALIILFFASLNSTGLGIIGIYVWRTFENTKKRPEAMVMAQRQSKLRRETWIDLSTHKQSVNR